MVQACEVAQQLVTPLVKIGEDSAQKTQQGKPFPLVLSPVQSKMTFVQLQEYVLAKHEQILKAASEYGAVMFSGFEILSGEEWASVLYKTGIKEMNYIGGAAVRKLIVGNDKSLDNMQILTTNESPPSEPIPFHHELAQTPNPPDHICFYCQYNESEGGSTPLIRSDMVYDYLKGKYPDFITKVEDLGVRYVKVAPAEDDPSSALGRSWKSMYGVSDKAAAEAAAKEQGSTIEWQDNGDAKVISAKLPAVRVSSNGNKTFFNQVIAAYTGWIDSRNDPKKAVTYGDGTPLPHEALDDLAAYMAENQMAAAWTPGKFVIVDNTVAYHSRQTFSGPRRVLAAIGQGTKPVTDKQTHLVLHNGTKMPQVGLGCWKIPKEVCAQTVYDAIEVGYRCLDGACDYGNEKEVGQGIKMALDAGICKREDLFVVSKLWNTFHRPEHVEEACRKTLSDLGLDYLDLYLIHFPIAMPYVPIDFIYPPEWVNKDPKINGGKERMCLDDGVTYRETYTAMEELYYKGLVKNIGICNVQSRHLREIQGYARVKPAVLQVEIHPKLTQERLIRQARDYGMAVTGFSTLGALSYIELNMATEAESMTLNNEVQEIATRYGKSPAQVVFRWALQRGTQIIPKSSKKERLIENISIFDFCLTQDEMDKISSFNENKRFNDPGFFTQGMGCYCPIYD